MRARDNLYVVPYTSHKSFQPGRLGRNVTSQCRYEGLEARHLRHVGKQSGTNSPARRCDEGRGCVKLFLHQLLTQDVVSLEVRRIPEFIEYGEVRRLVLDGGS